jgi:uncharacterized protein (TIRG00374 family)
MSQSKDILKIFSTWRIMIAVLIGFSVSLYFVLDDFELSTYSKIHWSFKASFFLVLAILLEALRDFAYMYRIRLLTDKQISWKHSVQTIMLWEFASALTPSVVGGSAVALFIVEREIRNFGKATAIVMITALFDELFYVIMVPIVFLIIGTERIFIDESFNLFNFGAFPTQYIFFLGYFFIFLLTLIITLAIFVSPGSFKKILHYLFSLPILRKWQQNAENMGEEIVITSREMKGRSMSFWLKVWASTMVSWTARFAVINVLILTLFSFSDQLLIFGRQLAMWVILLISPTPGGSGIAEFILPKFLGEFMHPFDHEVAFTWRLLSYYSYLIIGSIILPIWLKRVLKKQK